MTFFYCFKNSNVTVFVFQFLYSFLNVLRLLFRKLCERLAGSVAFFTDFFGVSVHIDLKRQCGISKSMRNEYKHTHTRTPSSQVCLSVSLHKSGRRGQCYRSAAVQCTCVYVCVCVCLHVCMCPCPSIIPFRKNERWRTAGPLCLSSQLAWTTLNNLLINLPKPQKQHVGLSPHLCACKQAVYSLFIRYFFIFMPTWIRIRLNFDIQRNQGGGGGVPQSQIYAHS